MDPTGDLGLDMLRAQLSLRAAQNAGAILETPSASGVRM
jgi:hypothetical protein